MSSRSFTLRALILLGLLAAPAFGQFQPKGEIFGTIGIGKTYDDEGSLGSGLNGGGGVGYRPFRRLGLEAEVNGFRSSRSFGSSPPAVRLSGAFVMGNGLLYFGRGRAQPFLLAGAGLLHIHNLFGFAGVPTDLSGDGFAVNFGFGVKIFATPHIVLRPEIRLFGGDGSRAVESPFTDIRLSMGVGYCW